MTGTPDIRCLRTRIVPVSQDGQKRNIPKVLALRHRGRSSPVVRPKSTIDRVSPDSSSNSSRSSTKSTKHKVSKGDVTKENINSVYIALLKRKERSIVDNFVRNMQRRRKNRHREATKHKLYKERSIFIENCKLPTFDKQDSRLIHKDVSGSKEVVPIRARCSQYEEKKVEEFEYITSNVYTKQVQSIPATATYRCSCTGKCGADCSCVQASINKGSTCILNDQVLSDINTDCYNSTIFACGVLCGCKGNCSNTIDTTQNIHKLELFRRDMNIGWAVKTIADIPAGTVVSEFCGEVINENEYNKRTDVKNSLTDSYSFQLYSDTTDRTLDYILKLHNQQAKKSSPTIIIDPSKKGNISRFFSHGDFPNLIPLRMFVNDLRPSHSRLLFVAARTIYANTELFFDYGDRFKGEKIRSCLCGTIACEDSRTYMLIEHREKLVKLILDKLPTDYTVYNDLLKKTQFLSTEDILAKLVMLRDRSNKQQRKKGKKARKVRKSRESDNSSETGTSTETSSLSTTVSSNSASLVHQVPKLKEKRVSTKQEVASLRGRPVRVVPTTPSVTPPPHVSDRFYGVPNIDYVVPASSLSNIESTRPSVADLSNCDPHFPVVRPVKRRTPIGVNYGNHSPMATRPCKLPSKNVPSPMTPSKHPPKTRVLVRDFKGRFVKTTKKEEKKKTTVPQLATPESSITPPIPSESVIVVVTPQLTSSSTSPPASGLTSDSPHRSQRNVIQTKAWTPVSSSPVILKSASKLPVADQISSPYRLTLDRKRQVSERSGDMKAKRILKMESESKDANKITSNGMKLRNNPARRRWLGDEGFAPTLTNMWISLKQSLW